ncbi:MAG: ArsB/NhaD family transporter [Euryarchaeota archaeon]|nr:ArsB/NhaD family transporter [Euryarchaeota archaeon]
MDVQTIIGIIILVIVYSMIASERVHRTIAAMFGAALTIIVLAIMGKPVENVLEYIDMNTILLLVSMMIIVTIAEKSGLFNVLSWRIAKLSKGSLFALLALLSVLTGVLSAFVDNVTTVLIVGPITLEIVRRAHVDPRPFVLSEIFASNIGGTATLIGDPPNIIIGSQLKLSFNAFLMNTAPISFLILLVLPLMMYVMFKRDVKGKILSSDVIEGIPHKPEDIVLYKESIAILILVIVLFMTEPIHHIPSPMVALIGASILLLVSRVNITEVIKSVDWATIVFFMMLFIVVGGISEMGVISFIANSLSKISASPYLLSLLILWISMVLSGFVDNIPYVATMIPVIRSLNAALGIKSAMLAWALSLGGCFGGNLTPVGASANVVLLSIADRYGCHITWKEYLKYGSVLIILSGILSSIYLLRYL